MSVGLVRELLVMESFEQSESNLLIEKVDGGDGVVVSIRLRERLLLAIERLVKGKLLGVLNESMLLTCIPDGRVGFSMET